MAWIALVELVLLGLMTAIAVRGLMHAVELERLLEELEEQLAHLKASKPLIDSPLALGGQHAYVTRRYVRH